MLKRIVTLIIVLMMGFSLLAFTPNAQAATVDWVNEGKSPFTATSTANAQLPDGRMLVSMGYNTTSSLRYNQTWILDPATMAWDRVADSPNSTESSCAVALPSGKVYVFGGLDISGALETVLIYNVSADSWTVGPECPTKGYFPRAVALDENRFLMAGGGQGVVDCYIYDERTNAFTQVADMPEGRSAGALVKAGENVYYFGGFYSATPQDDIFLYNTQYDYWTAVGTLPAVNQGLQGAFSADGLIYLVGGGQAGGWYGTNGLEAYAFDPYDYSFIQLPDLPEGLRYGVVFDTADGELFALSGHEGSTGNDDIYSLKLWEIEASLSSDTVGQGESAWLSMTITANFAPRQGFYGTVYLTAMGVTYATYDISSMGSMAYVEIPISQEMTPLGYVLEFSDVGSIWLQEFYFEPLALTVTDTESVDEQLEQLDDQNQDLQDQLSELNDELNDTRDELGAQNEDLKDQLEQAQQDLDDAVNAKMDAMIGYVILILALASLAVGVIILVRKK